MCDLTARPPRADPEKLDEEPEMFDQYGCKNIQCDIQYAPYVQVERSDESLDLFKRRLDACQLWLSFVNVAVGISGSEEFRDEL
jgi:hypothetical protein